MNIMGYSNNGRNGSKFGPVKCVRGHANGPSRGLAVVPRTQAFVKHFVNAQMNHLNVHNGERFV